MYFSTIMSEDWLRAVNAWSSCPQHHPSMDADDEGLESHGPGGDHARTEYVHEKLRGKRSADEESSVKRRKMARPSRGEEGLVSIGGST